MRRERPKIPADVRDAVVALVGGYASRERAADLSGRPSAYVARCREINQMIDDCIRRVCSGEPCVCAKMRHDISNRCGYHTSRLKTVMSEMTFYTRKNDVMAEIAVAAGYVNAAPEEAVTEPVEEAAPIPAEAERPAPKPRAPRKPRATAAADGEPKKRKTAKKA